MNGIPNSLPILDGKNWVRWRKQMQSLFGFQETLKLITNGILELAQNVNDAQRVTHNDTKKKDCKVAFHIQSAVDATNFDLISHAELEKDA